MYTELSYLLEELDNWDDDKPIQVKDLKRMINKAFEKMEKDEQELDDSFVPPF